jgi:hypothetical protein
MSYDKPYESKPYPDSGKLTASKVKKHEKASDYFGEIAIDLKNMKGVDVVDGLHIFKLSGWKKVSKAGNTFLSLSINHYVPEDKGNTVPMSKRAPAQQEEDEF